MNNIARWLALSSLCISAAVSVGDVPRLFIVQLEEDREAYPDFESLLLDTYLAAALDEIGQVSPLVWSMSDSKFRLIAGQKSFPMSWANPMQSEIVAVSRAVDADYTLVVWCRKTDNLVRPIATLYRGSGFKKIWTYGDWDRRMAEVSVSGGNARQLTEEEIRDLRSMQGVVVPEFASVVVNNKVDWDTTSRTIARTLAFLIQQEPLKGLRARPVQGLPDADPGSQVPLPVGVRINDAGMGMEQIEALVLAGETGKAIVYLRDMIDREPFRDDFRVRLAELLEGEGLFIEAAREATRSAALVKRPLPLYHLAARNWLRGGNMMQAREALNNILARGGEDRNTQAMLGQLYLREGDYEVSVEWYSKAVRNGPTPTIVFERAIAQAMAGQIDQCRADLASLVDVPGESITDSYIMMVELCEEVLEGVGVRVRDRMPLHRIHRTDASLITLTARDRKLAESMSALMDLTVVPVEFKSSHELRALAHKLMYQSVTEVFEYATTRKEDLASEAALSLRESLNMLPKIRGVFKRERSMDRT